MLRTTTLLASVVLVTTAFAQASLAADPPGSTPSGPRGPSPDAPSALPLPDRGPDRLTIGVVVPPEPIRDLTVPDSGAESDQQIDVLLGAVPPDPDGGFGLATAPDPGVAASAANCWPDGTGCGGSEAQFVANCDSAGGGMSSEHDPDNGPYIRCTLPSAE